MSWVTRLCWWPISLLLLVVACQAPARETPSESVLRVGTQLESDNPLQARAMFTTEALVSPTMTVKDEQGRGMRIVSTEPASGAHDIPLLGLRPDTTYTVEVEADGATGSTNLLTGGLPDDLPPIVVESEPDRMSPGLTLFNAIPLNFGAESEATEDGYLIAVDDEGEVVWFYRQTHSIQDVRQSTDGQLLFINHETGARKLDPTDGSVIEWSGTTGLDDVPQDGHGRSYAGDGAIRVDTEQMHHEIIELPNGNLMTLSREVRSVEGFPEPICDDGDEFTGSYDVVGDTIVEFRPDDGEIVAEWSLFDLARPLDDLSRIRPSEFCSNYLSDLYPGIMARDWTHANGVVLDAERNAVLVSVRHLDQVWAIRYADDDSGPAGELLWRLGENGDFTLEDGEWFLHQHATEVLADGSIMLYDNGNERPGTSLDDPDRLPYSRAVQYEIDTERFVARQVWEHRADSPGEAVYAPFLGDADLLEGGTVLITHGGQLDPPAHMPGEGVVAWGRVIEVDYDTGEIVFDVRMKDPKGEAGWIIYRAERIDSIYPPTFTVEMLGG